MNEQRLALAFQFLQDEPKAAARLLEQQSASDAADFLSHAPAPAVVRLLQNMLPDLGAAVLGAAEQDNATVWMLALNTPDLCVMLRHLAAPDMARLLAYLPLKRQAACQLLLSYRADMVGAWAETDVPVVSRSMLVGEVVKRLQRKRFSDSRYIVVLDEERHPIGVVEPASLFQAKDQLPITKTMHAMGESLRGRMTLVTAAQQRCWQQQDMVGVVNRHHQWVGLLWHSQLRAQLDHQVAHPRLSQQHHHAVNELLLAHSNSMKGLLTSLKESLKV